MLRTKCLTPILIIIAARKKTTGARSPPCTADRGGEQEQTSAVATIFWPGYGILFFWQIGEVES